nr:FAD-dependent thymidylate synthase [Paenibacillus bovis]
MYSEALELGIAAEQSRLFLPSYGMYVRWFWTSSLQGVAHFLSQRLENDAQKENKEYAKVVEFLAEEHFPVALDKTFEIGIFYYPREYMN